jgi:RNA polymerase-binding protein DksA
MKTLMNDVRERLERRKASLLRLYAATRRDETEVAGTTSPDWPDRAALQAEAGLLQGLAERERLELVDIQAALDRLQQGRYGRCERCGNAIGRQRLAAIPEARLCMGCSEPRALAR